MSSTLFITRIALAWAAAGMAAFIIYSNVFSRGRGFALFMVAVVTLVALVRAFSHVRRVRLMSNRPDAEAFGSRHRRQVEIPLPASQAFAIVEAAIRELPYVETVQSTGDSLQVYARLKRMDPYLGGRQGPKPAMGASGARRNLVTATVTPGENSSSLNLVCEPEGGGWVDWFMVDDGTNLETAEAVSRAITRRLSEQRRGEQESVRQTTTQKELAVAKLSLLHAQVEPHFLYNTLASAQVLTRSDPARADLMLGHLITYLRRSLPSADEAMSTLGQELERARAYLEILRIRMGERLQVQVQVPAELEATPMPPMMLQTVVENAIKHGLEPIPGGGTIWVLARAADGKVAVTVADDGRGFSEEGGGTGIGLKNVRERLRLAYGDAASFSITGNFPKGVAATITLPARSA